MKAKYVQKGDSIDYTPVAAAVNAGDIVVIGDIVGVAKLDIAVGELGALAVVGVYDVVKATSEGSAISAGAKLFWNAGDQIVTTVAAGNVYMGEAIRAAIATDETVRVRLNGAATPTSLPSAGSAVADADAITATSPTWGNTTTEDQAANLGTFSAAVVADLGELRTQLNAALAALRTYGVVAAE